MTDKNYYSIKEAAELLGITYAHLHHLEKELPELHIIRTKTGRRMYHRDQLEQIRKIILLTREKGISIKTAGTWILQSGPENDIMERIEGLRKIKSFLVIMKSKMEEAQKG